MSFVLLNALGDIVSTDPDMLDKHACDWSNVNRQRPRAVLRPRTVADVSVALRLCHEAGIAVVPQGGLTGLAGGATPQTNQVVLSLERLKGIEEIDRDSATMTVLAGTPLEIAQKAAEEAGLYLALDIGSRGSCQIGGNISTNAGGTAVLRYGPMRDLVLGLEVVLPDGRVFNGLRALRKDNTGYALKQLFIGAEGTLGIITAATLKLYPKPEDYETTIVSVTGPEAALSLFQLLRERIGGRLNAFEIVPLIGLELQLRHGMLDRDSHRPPSPGMR